MSSPQQPYDPPAQFPPPAQAPGAEPYPGASSYPGPGAPGWGGHPHPGPGGPGAGAPPYGGDGQGPGGYPYPGPVARMPDGYSYAGPQQYGPPYPGPYGGPPPAPKRGVPVWAWVSGAITLVAVVVVLLVVFTDGAPSRPGTGTLPANPAAAPRAPEPPAPSGNRPAPGGSGGGADSASAGFGQPVTTPDGLTIEVSTPVSFTPSEYAAGDDRERSIKITTTVTNGGSEPYELNGLLLGPQGTHAGEEAVEILDFGNGAAVIPLETVQPGASFSYEVAFSIGGQPSELRLVYSPDFTGDEVVIAGEV